MTRDLLPDVCPWCGNRVESHQEKCPGCGQMPDWKAWVDNAHTEAELLAPPGWEGLVTNEPLGSIADVAGYLRRELAALRIVGESGRGPFWLERANQLYANVFRALDDLRIADRPEQPRRTTATKRNADWPSYGDGARHREARLHQRNPPAIPLPRRKPSGARNGAKAE